MRLKRSPVTIAVKDKDGNIRFIKTRAKKVRISPKGLITTIIYENGTVYKIDLKRFIEAFDNRADAVREYAWLVKELSGVEGIDKKILNKLLP